MSVPSELFGSNVEGCGRGSAWKLTDGILKVVPLLCGRWSCARCGPQRYAWFVEGVRGQIEAAGCVRFLTVTLNASWGSGEEAHRHINASWARLRLALYKRGDTQSFVRVLEGTKKGTPHLHVFTSLYLLQRDWSCLWDTASMGSSVVDIRRLKNSDAASYVAKYCVKESRRRRERETVWRYKCRVFSTSQDIKLPPYRSLGQGGWERVDKSIALICEHGRGLGMSLDVPSSDRSGLRIPVAELLRTLEGDVVLPWGQLVESGSEHACSE